MKLAFWRGSRGRHALGAAVTSIPSGPVAPSALPAPAPLPSPVPARVVDPPVEVAAPAQLVDDAAQAEDRQVPVGPRVELGFRDGSHAALDPASPQARALESLAAALTGRG